MNVDYAEQAARPLAPVREEPFHEWVFPDGTQWTQFFRKGPGYLLRFPNFADFEVSADGRTVWGFPAPGVDSPTVEHLYLNQVLPLALSRQGRLVLHGSAVDIDGHGVAFLGVSGRGKSTLAASFSAEGMRFLTDDGLLLEWTDTGCLIVPSHPSIRLWQDSEAALMKANAATAPAVSFTAKSRFLAGEGIPFCHETRPLHRVFVLGEGATQRPTIEPLRPAEALFELVKNSFLLDTQAHDVLTRHFEDLTQLADRPIHYRLDYPRDYTALPAVRAAVLQQIGKLGQD